MVVELFAADTDGSGPTFRRFFRFWVTKGTASGSVVICEALRFPSVGSSSSAGGWGAGSGGRTTGMLVLIGLAATAPAFYSVVSQKGSWHTRYGLPSTDLSDLR